MEHLEASFIAEATELINDLEAVLLQYEEDLENRESIELIFRIMHTLKGASGMFGYTSISSVTHEMESVFDSIRDNRLKSSKDILSVTLATVDHLKHLLEDKVLNCAGNQAMQSQLLSQIRGLMPNTTTAVPEQVLPTHHSSAYYIYFEPAKAIFKTGTNLLFTIDDLHQLGTLIVRPVLNQLPELELLDPESCYLAFEMVLITDKPIAEIKEAFIFVERDSTITIEDLGEANLIDPDAVQQQFVKADAGNTVTGADGVRSLFPVKRSSPAKQQDINRSSSRGSIRVASEKLDELMNLISELVTSQASLSLLARQEGIQGLENLSENMEKITRRLRDNAFSICLIPLQTLETRFRRLVRDLADDLGKEIRFVMEGAETELDKSIIEKITDPIIHILRNCVDHGIELPEQRQNKDREGTIRIKAFHAGTSVHILVEDDGRGLDADKIKAKAIARGLINSEQELSHEELVNLIFHPGFSTAEKVTDVSGRGVGMDIVKQNIEDLHGEVSVRSTVNAGTCIAIKLPLTLSIVDGLLVKIGASDYLLPLTSVDKCYEVPSWTLSDGLAGKLCLDGDLVPVFNLRKAFDEHGSTTDVTPVITLHHEKFHAGVTVDTIIGEYQAVMKPLGKACSKQDEFSGATILGDGTVALVVDTNKLLQKLSR